MNPITTTSEELVKRFLPEADQIISFASDLSSGPESTREFIAMSLARAWVAGGREAISAFPTALGRISGGLTDSTPSPRLALDDLALEPEYPHSEIDGGWQSTRAEPAD